MLPKRDRGTIKRVKYLFDANDKSGSIYYGHRSTSNYQGEWEQEMWWITVWQVSLKKEFGPKVTKKDEIYEIRYNINKWLVNRIYYDA